MPTISTNHSENASCDMDILRDLIPEIQDEGEIAKSFGFGLPS
jgi:hypothetical protein